MLCVRHWGATDGQNRGSAGSHSLVQKTDNKLALIMQCDKLHDRGSEKEPLSPAGIFVSEAFLQDATQI